MATTVAMPRLARFVLPNAVHHVVARGVNGANLFDDHSDKDHYLRRFALVAAEEQVLIHGYCLMDNHVHWLLTPLTERSLARLFSRVHTWWATLYNRRHHRTGHLFQSRYHSAPMDEQHYWEALRYVELNPCNAGLVATAAAWPHSSARAHLTAEQAPSALPLVPLLHQQRHYSPGEWRFFLGQDPPAIAAALLAASAASRPWGDPAWIERLEHTHLRRFVPLPQGRPRKRRTLTAA